ncbi:cytochrome P450 [Streptomyces sp. GQFP]|uniref:cytochrome P450 n=1 Tax=Streptomyces sp. GQFP TaxID=2907545 RepID=UPI001F1C7061|nr:cytochrome P450 [Streptomyces sp. GQFP]UIX32065.1 cytochrome P450 [Streptomyces sp. GQFP]
MNETPHHSGGRCPVAHDRLPAPAPLPYVAEDPFHPAQRLQELRAEFPVSRLLYPGGETGWLVTRYADVRAVLADPVTFSSKNRTRFDPLREVPEEVKDPLVRPGLFNGVDPPEHGFYRKQLIAQFTANRMKSLEPRIEQIVAGQLDIMAAKGPVADLIADFALPVPSLVICELLGVDYAERQRFQAATAKAVSFESTTEDVRDALASLGGFMLDLVHQKQADPDDALLSGLIQAQEGAERLLTDEELTNMVMFLLIAGHETTANMLGLGTLSLLHHPEQLAKLKADPSLVDNAVEELLRFNSIVRVGLLRVATRDVEFGGQFIPVGSPVVASLLAANRDPERFDDPDELDISRAGVHHVSFGHGVHKCLGKQLARTEMRIGYRRLFERFPDLRLAIPLPEVKWRTDMSIYGLHQLPVTW